MKHKKDLGALLPRGHMPRADEGRIQQTVSMGQDYMRRHVPEKTSVGHLFFEQLKYLSPLLWATQFMALIVVFSLTVSGDPSLHTAKNILFQLAPLTALLAVPELIKDSLYDMTELESSCKNSGSVILLMRLIAVGCINVLTLSLLAWVVAGVWHYRFLSLVAYALVPYNCVNVISLGMIMLLKIRGRSATQAIALLSAGLVFALPMTQDVANISGLVMLAILIGTTVVFIMQILKIFRWIPAGGRILWN